MSRPRPIAIRVSLPCRQVTDAKRKRNLVIRNRNQFRILLCAGISQHLLIISSPTTKSMQYFAGLFTNTNNGPNPRFEHVPFWAAPTNVAKLSCTE